MNELFVSLWAVHYLQLIFKAVLTHITRLKSPTLHDAEVCFYHFYHFHVLCLQPLSRDHLWHFSSNLAELFSWRSNVNVTVTFLLRMWVSRSYLFTVLLPINSNGFKAFQLSFNSLECILWVTHLSKQTCFVLHKNLSEPQLPTPNSCGNGLWDSGGNQARAFQCWKQQKTIRFAYKSQHICTDKRILQS